MTLIDMHDHTMRPTLRTSSAPCQAAPAALLALLLVLAQPSARAIGPKSDFGVTIGPAVLCRDKLEMKYLYDYLKGSFGEPYRHEQGAYWFRTKAQLFGKELTETFVSDQSTQWEFIGAVFKIKPDDLAKAMQSDIGPVFVKTATGYKYSPYQAQGLSEIMWQNNNAKMLCRHLVAPLP